jgi:hypothetical protein
MKQPILKLRSVNGLRSHPPTYDYRLRFTAEAHETPQGRSEAD